MLNLRCLLLPFFFIAVFTITIIIASNRAAQLKYEGVITWDTEGYYVYLPAVFIYGFENVPTRTTVPADGLKYLRPLSDTDKRIFTKYTYGEALFLAPFWLIAHGTALVMPDRFPPDGFSTIYVFSLFISVAFYLVLGLYLASRILRPYFSEYVVFLALMTIWLGTAFIQHTAFTPGNSHVFSFFLFCLFVYQTPGVLSRSGYWRVFLICLTFGWIVLLRPTNCIIFLYLLFYQVRTWDEFKSRIGYFIVNLRHWLLFPIGVFLILLPQFCYWHYVSGHWLLFSYTGESFMYWNAPKIIPVLFSPQDGFFVYAPLMLLTIPGFIIGWRDRRFNFPVNVLIIAIAIYSFASWWCWWFGACYGHRAFIDYFILFLFPLCIIYERIFSWGAWAKFPSLTVICFFLFISWRLNSLYTYPWEGPNWGWGNVWQKHKDALYIK